MIPLLLPFTLSIRMNQSREWPAINHQPRYERPKLSGSEYIHLEHSQDMRTNGSVPELVDAQLGKLPPYTFPQGSGILGLFFIVVVVVDVDVETTTDAVVEG